MTLKNKFFVILSIFIFTFCKHKENNCDQIPKPDMIFYEDVYKLIRTDTVLRSASVEFVAPDGYESYEWKIAYDERIFTTKIVRLKFESTDIGNYPVRLIAKRSPNIMCDPLDTGIDTFKRNITVVRPENAKILGRYKGKLEGSNEDQIIEVKTVPNGYVGQVKLNLASLSPECNKSYPSVSGYRYIYAALYPDAQSHGCYFLSAELNLDERDPSGNTIIMKYGKINPNPPYERTYHNFFGSRL